MFNYESPPVTYFNKYKIVSSYIKNTFMYQLPLYTITFLFACSAYLQSNGQNIVCGADYLHNKLSASNPAYAAKTQTIESQVQHLLRNMPHVPLDAVYSIPVVVHVIHLGEPIGTGTNISDSQITVAIRGLNNRWRNANPMGGVNMDMQFCLASRDPNGNVTTGINRVNASGIPNYAAHGISMVYSNCDAPSEATIKGLSKWPVSDYYNIWVVNQICQGFGGIVGVAYYPWGADIDGTTIASWVMREDDYTLAHEVGHGFNLRHTFEGGEDNVTCPLNSPCSSYGDLVCDTPPQKVWDCDNTANPCAGIGTWGNSVYNYMSYCGIKDRFTQGQKDRARASAIVAPRASLLTSLGCSAPLVYTFTGNGNYNVASNWQGNIMPPANLPAGSQITIDPLSTGTCIMNVPQTIMPGGKFIVSTGKKIIIQGNLRVL